ncbi:MAG: hypothetical protein FWG64_11155 [Firmicutes bacterium]|nr:hypothetical protein [Bacillota bacterium]
MKKFFAVAFGLFLTLAVSTTMFASNVPSANDLLATAEQQWLDAGSMHTITNSNATLNLDFFGEVFTLTMIQSANMAQVNEPTLEMRVEVETIIDGLEELFPTDNVPSVSIFYVVDDMLYIYYEDIGAWETLDIPLEITELLAEQSVETAFDIAFETVISETVTPNPNGGFDIELSVLSAALEETVNETVASLGMFALGDVSIAMPTETIKIYITIDEDGNLSDINLQFDFTINYLGFITVNTTLQLSTEVLQIGNVTIERPAGL